MGFSKKTREEVYKKYDGHCAYCGKKIEIKEMQIDHMHPKAYGESYARIVGKVELESIENYMPSCGSCNHYKRALSFEGFRKQMLTLPLEQFDGKFYFEKCKFYKESEENV